MQTADIATACFEVTSGIIRFFETGGEYGAPFDMAIFVVGDENRATLKGLRSDQNFRPLHARVIARELAKFGFDEVIWYRQRDGVRREVRVRINEAGDCTWLKVAPHAASMAS